ncbi:cell wall-binding repeat-containing protein [Herbiconiux sp. CPCC 205763]|uniref:Cell wall-binding repeat-containing protein n=1 Tax=Herbiconiux aconitum TaxID=2970913 RepID=A0ABT2GN07_9MICO|nr:cell wall-binding repeat-containing protein [Herbiconiux aconitum]MCS5716972.1 cell wall-binding repeat-containing protein [Herbiconiux aconitum]
MPVITDSVHEGRGRGGLGRLRLAGIAAAVAVIGSVALAPAAANAEELVPVLNNDAYTLSAGQTFTTPAGQGVFANDVDLGLNALISIVAGPTHGSIEGLGDGGEFTYSPDNTYVGSDSFVYCIKLGKALPCLPLLTAKVTLTVEPTIERIGGADRYAVSAGVSAKFPADIDTVYVASGAVFPDALSASAAAGAQDAPVLLVTKDAIPAVVDAELRRLQPQRIVLMGGLNTIGAAVETALGAYTDAVDRIGGADRFVVSAAVSRGVFDPDREVAYVASGEVFPDALSGSAAAGLLGGPVLLVTKTGIPADVKTELERLHPSRIVVLGGTNTVADSVATGLTAIAPTTRIDGADRYAVSASVSADAFDVDDTGTVYVASGEVFPDALSGSAAAIHSHAPVLLVSKESIPATIATELDRINPVHIVVLGGINTISDATYAALATHLG